MNNILYPIVYVLGVIIAATAQVMLKQSAGVKRENKLKEYLNFKTIFAYGLMFVATVCTVIAYKQLPLAIGPILGTTEYIFVAAFSKFFLKEKINRQKMVGLGLIIIGVLVCAF